MTTIDTENAKDIRKSMRVNVTIGTISGSDYYLSLYSSSLIRVVVSLRSDLSKINPTLPESEIEIEAYYPQDISADVAKLKDETPITFRAGYTDDWSFTRRFYTDEGITWDKGILHIHARDQVHKLDGELPSIYLGQKWARSQTSTANNRAFTALYAAFYDIIQGGPQGYQLWQPLIYSVGNIIRLDAEVSPEVNDSFFKTVDGWFSTLPEGGAVNSIIEHKSRREMVAQLMNLCHQDYPTGYFNGLDSFWLTYVDAGYPNITYTKPTSKFTIYEEDCGDIVESHERNVSQYQFKVRDVLSSGYFRRKQDGVNATAFKASGIAVDYQGFVDLCYFGLFDATPPDEEVDFTYLWNQYQNEEMLKRSRPYSTTWTDTAAWKRANKYGMWLLDESLEENEWNPGGLSFLDLSGATWTSAHSTSQSPSARWNSWVSSGYIDSTAETASLDVTGYFFLATNEHIYTINTNENGQIVKPDEIMWNGKIYAANYNNPSNYLTILPDYGLESIAKRSSKIGSFTWKGDPRMQPRDVFTFVSVDGESKDCTAECITLTYEKGGLIAEITYREGIC